jgi:hypothetical protein
LTQKEIVFQYVLKRFQSRHAKQSTEPNFSNLEVRVCLFEPITIGMHDHVAEGKVKVNRKHRRQDSKEGFLTNRCRAEDILIQNPEEIEAAESIHNILQARANRPFSTMQKQHPTVSKIHRHVGFS